jgi:hypothetical protein
MSLSTNTILFLLVGLIAIAVVALAFYIFRNDRGIGKTLYDIEKRLGILEQKVSMDKLEQYHEEEVLANSKPISEHIVEEHYRPQPITIANPLDMLMRSAGGLFKPSKLVNLESEEEITREIEELKKQLETESSGNKSETIEIISDTKSKLSDIKEVSDESSSSTIVENSNASVATNGQTHNEILHEFEDLGDTDHIENTELDSYINNAIIENNEDIEKKLEEMSNSSHVDADVQYNVRIELIANSSKLKDIKELCKKNSIAIGSSSKTELVRKLYKINPDIYDLLVTNKETYTKENSNLN